VVARLHGYVADRVLRRERSGLASPAAARGYPFFDRESPVGFVGFVPGGSDRRKTHGIGTNEMELSISRLRGSR